MKNIIFATIIASLFASCSNNEQRIIFKSKQGTIEVATFDPYYHPIKEGHEVAVYYDGYEYRVVPAGSQASSIRRTMEIVRVDSIITAQ
jgi:hypothetical protein